MPKRQKISAGGAFQPGKSGLIIRGDSLNVECRTNGGRKRQDKIRKIINDLLIYKSFQFQSLNTGNYASWSAQGSYQLRAVNTINPSGGAEQINFPMYCFRLSSPGLGVQSLIPTNLAQIQASPLVAYQLVATRPNAGEAYKFGWRATNPQYNGTESAGSALNKAYPVFQESQQAYNVTKIKHVKSVVNVLYTAPQVRLGTLQVGLVRFNKAEYAPPDEFINENNGQIITYRVNSGSFSSTETPSPPVIAVPNPVDTYEMSEWYHQHFYNRDGHPLRYMSVNPKPKKPFKVVKFLERSFMPRSTQDMAYNPTANAATAIQHKHEHIQREDKWLDTSVSEFNVTDDNMSTVNQPPSVLGNATGLFPHPEKQLWFMVCGFERLGVRPFGEEFTPVNHGSFDISIRNVFASSALATQS